VTRLALSAALTPTSAGLLLRSDLGVFQASGPRAEAFLALLTPLLDGTRDRAAVVAALSGHAPAAVAQVLDLFLDRGLVEELPEGPLDEPRRGQLAFFRRWSPDGAPATRLAASRVVLLGEEAWAEAAAAALAEAGLGRIARSLEDAGDPDRCLLLAALPWQDAAACAEVARAAHRAGLRTLWARLEPNAVALGPLTVPGRTACRICAAAEGVNPKVEPPPPPGARRAIMARHLGNLAALEAIKILSEYRPSLLGGRVLHQDLGTFVTRLHTLARLPWCPVCGTSAG
jgi:hypothetical protein